MIKLPIKIKFLFLPVLMLLAACQVKTPKDIIQPDEMEALLYDYHIVQAMGSEAGSASDYHVKLYYEYVFDKHGVTKALFDSSMVWYTRHPGYLTQIYANLQDRLDYEVAMLQEDKVLMQVAKVIDFDYSKDTVELWDAMMVKKLTSAPLNNKMQMTFASDTAFVEGDSVAFNFDTRFISRADGHPQVLYAALLLTYKDNSSQSAGLTITTSGKYTLQIPRDYSRIIKGIDAFVYYTDGDKKSLSGVLLSELSVVRIHPPLEEEE